MADFNYSKEAFKQMVGQFKFEIKCAQDYTIHSDEREITNDRMAVYRLLEALEAVNIDSIEHVRVTMRHCATKGGKSWTKSWKWWGCESISKEMSNIWCDFMHKEASAENDLSKEINRLAKEHAKAAWERVVAQNKGEYHNG